MSAKALTGIELLLLDWVSKNTGIVIHDHQIPTFRMAIDDVCREFSCNSAEDFYHRLIGSERRSSEKVFFIKRITVGETYFFRIPEQIAFLRSPWLSETVRRKREENNLSLRIWSAGCSGGEELYTVALLLKEAIPDLEQWSIHLLGTDINMDSLGKARKAIYTSWSLRTLSEEERGRFFDYDDSLYHLHADVRQMAQFDFLNLFQDPYPNTEYGLYSLDLILCRNVFIYFSADVVKHIMSGFVKCLNEQGSILLAPSDFISQQYDGLALKQFGEVFYFQRDFNEQWQDNLSAESTVESGQTDTSPDLMAEPKSMAMAEQIDETSADIDSAIKVVSDKLTGHLWQDAMQLAEQLVLRFAQDSRSWYWLARCQSFLGKMSEAQDSCIKGLRLNDMDIDLQHLYSNLLMDQGRFGEAEQALRRVLYMNWERPDVHFELAMLRERDGKMNEVIKHLENALTAAGKYPPDAVNDPVSGMTFGRLVEILEIEIKNRKK